MCRATCHAVTGKANPSGEMPNISQTKAGTAVVVRVDAKLGWRLTTVGLRSKMYSILTVQPDGARKEKRKIKGVPKKAATNVRPS